MITTPDMAVARNGARQPHSGTSIEPNIGAIIGAAVKIITMTDISLADSTPLETSLTMALASTMPADEPMPWMKRAISSTSVFVAKVVTKPAIVNRPMPP